MSIVNRTLTTSPYAVYTSSGQSVITLGYFCNTDSQTRYINLWLVPNGNNADVSNIIYSNVAIAKSDTMVLDKEKIILDNGDALYANATSAGVVVTTIGYIGL